MTIEMNSRGILFDLVHPEISGSSEAELCKRQLGEFLELIAAIKALGWEVQEDDIGLRLDNASRKVARVSLGLSRDFK